MICKIEVAPKLLECTNFGATFLYRRLVREKVNTYAHRFYDKIFEAIHIKSDEVLLANRASICLIQ